jgi:Uma2 family endonuclease
MSTVTRQRAVAGVRQRRFTKAEYHRMGEEGFFRGERVELIEGILMVYCPQLAPHSTSVYLAQVALSQVFTTGHLVRVQLPLDLGQTTEPEPDVAVVAGDAVQFSQAQPRMAVLVVEVSDSTLSFDRGRKGSLYARAGIADYWVVNLVNRQVEVYRDPIPDAAEPYGHRYASRTDAQPGGSVSPLALPSAAVAVNSLIV